MTFQRKIAPFAVLTLSALALSACAVPSLGGKMDMDKVRAGKFSDDVFNFIPNIPQDIDIQRQKDSRLFAL